MAYTRDKANRIILRLLAGEEVSRPEVYVAAVAWILGTWREYEDKRLGQGMTHRQALESLEEEGRAPTDWPGHRLYVGQDRRLAKRHAAWLIEELLPRPDTCNPRRFGKFLSRICQGSTLGSLGPDPYVDIWDADLSQEDVRPPKSSTKV